MNMEYEDSCDTGLVLGLGGRSDASPKTLKSSSPISAIPMLREPSLTLGLSELSPSPPQNVKRENEYEVNQEAAERVSSRNSDEEEEGGVRKKLRLTKEQSALLEDKFREHATLNPQKQKQALAKQLNLRPRQVEVWFQNRRARTKLKQTEVDCEVLKRCCETLSDENRRLQKELEELKALRSVVPTPPPALYMQPPPPTGPANITICPSCQSISGPVTKATASFIVASKAQFLNPFAC